MESHRNLISFIDDKHLSMAMPFVAYWIYSLFFSILDSINSPWLSKYRIHTPEELTKRNRVTRSAVLGGVVLQQAIQTVVGLILMLTEPDEVIVNTEESLVFLESFLIPPFEYLVVDTRHLRTIASMLYFIVIPALQFFVAFLVLDTWQYFWHRFMHRNKFFYKHFHSWHHQLYVPYSFGALYNHPVEGLIMDTIGAGIAFKLAFMSVRQGIFFFTISTMKTVDDHCGYELPFDPFQMFFSNNAKYHDIHHQHYGMKKNFSQPYFTIWDRLLGTYMPADAPRPSAKVVPAAPVAPVSTSSPPPSGPLRI